MIISVRVGDVEVGADDEMTDSRPTPELTEDTARRLMRVAIRSYKKQIKAGLMTFDEANEVD